MSDQDEVEEVVPECYRSRSRFQDQVDIAFEELAERSGGGARAGWLTGRHKHRQRWRDKMATRRFELVDEEDLPGVGFHFQAPVNDWPRAAARLPAGTNIKAVDNAGILREAKAHNRRLRTILRHWYDHGQIFGGSYDQNKGRAREFFHSFIDGTFFRDKFYETTDLIEEFNEYLANSQNDAERADRVRWATAAADVWLNEFRRRDARLAHIRLVLANAAIGNDIPLGIAQAAVQFDAVLGYHNYIPVHQGQILPDAAPYHEHRYYSGRWMHMDAAYRLASLDTRKLYWLFTEFGPVGATWHAGGARVGLQAAAPMAERKGAQRVFVYDQAGIPQEMEAAPARGLLLALAGNGSPLAAAPAGPVVILYPNDGWRHPQALAGDVPAYLRVCEYAMQRMADWNAANGNRALGPVLFTSGGGQTWRYFETRQPEMDAIAVHPWPKSKAKPKPDPEPEPPFAFEAWPTEHRVITQAWGANPQNYAKFGLPGHEGVDIKAPHGSPIYAVADGAVYMVGDTREYPAGHAYGVQVRIAHVGGWKTVYAHLDRRTVDIGDQVKAGQVIGYADNTGNSFGPHLHLTLKREERTYRDEHGVWPNNLHDPTPFLEAIDELPNWVTPGYERVVHVLPQDSSQAEEATVLVEARGSRQSIFWSVDDALGRNPYVKHVRLIVWDVDRVAGSEARLRAYINRFYQMPEAIEFRQLQRDN